MTEVLRLSDSCYLPAFLSLRGVLAKEAAVSEENLRVLALLTEPCKTLESAQPKVGFPLISSTMVVRRLETSQTSS